MKIVVCALSQDMVHADFAIVSLLPMIRATECEGHTVAIHNPRVSIVEKGRHEGVVKLIENGFDKIFFIDSDMTFPEDTLLKLLSHNKDIVGCDYTRRREPFDSTALDMKGNRLSKAMYKHHLLEVSAIGTGCLLIDSSVFSTFKEPYFFVAWKEGKFLSEDYMFCLRARSAGFNIYCDGALSREIGHIGIKGYRIGDRCART